MSFDVLQEKILEKHNPTVAGLDPKPEQIPPHILEAAYRDYGTVWLAPPRLCGSSTVA